jgi:transcriptional regulator with GAF, ATPase, and Fis domain
MNTELPNPIEPNFVVPLSRSDVSEITRERRVSGHNGISRLLLDFHKLSSKTIPGATDRQTPPGYQFEGLLVEILAKLVNRPLAELDWDIEQALEQICALLGLDQAQLWTSSGKDNDSFKLTHQCRPRAVIGAVHGPDAPGCDAAQPPEPKLLFPALPLGTNSKEHLPWTTAQARQGKKIIFSKFEELPAEAKQDRDILAQFAIRSGVMIPFRVDGDVFGLVNFANFRQSGWPEPLILRLELVAEIVAHATARKLAQQALAASLNEIKELKDRLQAESDYLRPEIKTSQAHSQIVGRSPGIKKVLHSVEQVAPVNCSVLINGETGTGKELIAQEIHHLSPRKERAMVLVNCAALPTALVESELFGRERGAYTGALTSQVGRFEVANGSTIFLDEVGELSMEVQAKLLRVLQQGEFQRLGSPRTHKVDVRVIAATNRDLAEEVRKGRFREDLYYRLNVFPIQIPPLRERAEDIPLLVFAFMEEFATRMGKKITKIPRKAMEVLQGHAWPGNIRELRNVIEHSVILSAGDTLKLTVLGEAPVREAQPMTLAEAEREHIMKTLESTRWRIKGPHGAAVRLDMQPSTLYSRMQKLGIPHRRQKDEMANH